jgi:hypothetical protein
MAQWAWQFSGLSHATKVDDYEAMLAHAIEIYKAAPDEEQKLKKARSTKKLASKVLNARLKMIRAKRYDTEPVKSEDWTKARKQVENLTEMETVLTSEGVDGILRELGFQSLRRRTRIYDRQ